jgi:hypothetical protein
MRLPDPARWTAPVRARLGQWGLGEVWLVWAGFVVGIAAVPAIAWHHYWPALALIVLSRALGLLPARSDLGEALDTVFFAGLLFAFALSDPAGAVAACYALFGFVASVSVVKRVAPHEALLLTFAFALACVLPNRFGVIAYALGMLGFVSAGLRIAGVR